MDHDKEKEEKQREDERIFVYNMTVSTISFVIALLALIRSFM